MNKKIHLSIMIIGLVMMIVISANAIIDHYADDIISAIPLMIMGAALFIAGYVKYENK